MAGDGTLGLILAGGGAIRLGGGDKTLLSVSGKPMLSHIIDRLSPQVEVVALNANGNPERFSSFGLPVLCDDQPGAQLGPLAGILAGMRWAHRWTDCGRLLTVAGDTPFFPVDIATRLREAVAGTPKRIAVASSGKRQHPVVALWPILLKGELTKFLASSKTYSVSAFLAGQDAVTVEFPFFVADDGRSVDPFFNVNTREDLAQANAIAARWPA